MLAACWRIPDTPVRLSEQSALDSVAGTLAFAGTLPLDAGSAMLNTHPRRADSNKFGQRAMDAATRTTDSADRDINHDEALAAAAQSGDRDALEILIERWYPAISRFFVSRTQEPDAAADLTQTTLERAARNIGQLKQASAFSPWLYRIARNTLYSRSRLDDPRGLSLEWLAAQPRGERHLVDTRDAITRWINDDIMLDAFDHLNPQAQEMLLLHHVQGYSGPEIATKLDISVMAVYQRLHRAELDYRRHYRALDAD